VSEADRGGHSRQTLSEVDGLIGMYSRWAEQSEHQNVLQADKALEAEGYIGGSGMHRRSTELGGADGAGGEQSINTLEVVRAVRTCQNLSGQDGTCPGLLLLHVGDLGVRHLWNITVSYLSSLTRHKSFKGLYIHSTGFNALDKNMTGCAMHCCCVTAERALHQL
jgi:hypothetical protein